MQHDIRKLCFDILRAIEDIKTFTEGLEYEQYQQNRLVRLAVERDYEIIGEALKRMEIRFADDFATVANGRKIIDFRNLLAHGYDEIADEIVWAITKYDINVLESDIKQILGQ
ncbi:MAG: DUF86 domain-containing protein [Acidobacteria bacterium]|nr:DUF86 domain-containing protein [Acidobacteriota bacterium]